MSWALPGHKPRGGAADHPLDRRRALRGHAPGAARRRARARWKRRRTKKGRKHGKLFLIGFRTRCPLVLNCFPVVLMRVSSVLHREGAPGAACCRVRARGQRAAGDLAAVEDVDGKVSKSGVENNVVVVFLTQAETTARGMSAMNRSHRC